MTPVATQPFLREFAIRVPGRADDVLAAMADQGILGGLSALSLTRGPDASLEDIENVVVVAVTERRTARGTRSLRRRDAKGGGVMAWAGGRAASAPLMGDATEPTIFELSVPGRSAYQLRTTDVPASPLSELVPAAHLRADVVDLPEVSERDLVGHFTRLSHRQYSVDLGAYPLGSCTMKYNPKFCDQVAADPGLTTVHPGAPAALTQGWLEILVTSEQRLCAVTGMAAVTLQPAAGAAGELTGLLLMRAFHDSNGDNRRRVIIPDSAHGTNPASVTLGGYEVTTVPSNDRGLRRPRRAARGVGHGRRRHHAHQSQHARTLRRGDHRDRRRSPRRGRPALLRRRQPQRHSGRRAPRRHGL